MSETVTLSMGMGEGEEVVLMIQFDCMLSILSKGETSALRVEIPFFGHIFRTNIGICGGGRVGFFCYRYIFRPGVCQKMVSPFYSTVLRKGLKGSAGFGKHKRCHFVS